jgi:hypothetical protein
MHGTSIMCVPFPRVVHFAHSRYTSAGTEYVPAPEGEGVIDKKGDGVTTSRTKEVNRTYDRTPMYDLEPNDVELDGRVSSLEPASMSKPSFGKRVIFDVNLVKKKNLLEPDPRVKLDLILPAVLLYSTQQAR